VARRATVVKQERAKDQNVLLLDAGDTLFGSGVANEADSTTLVGAMNLMRYDAMVPGEGDFAGGLTALWSLSDRAKFPWLAANLQLTSTRQPPWKPYVILSKDGRKVAILGIVDETLVRAVNAKVPDGERLIVTDPFQKARDLVDQLHKETNVVIVLSHLGLDKDVKLAQEIGGITAIIGGHSRASAYPPKVVAPHGTVVTQAGYNGEYLGVLRLKIDQSGQVVESGGELVALAPEIPEDSEMKSFLAASRKR